MKYFSEDKKIFALSLIIFLFIAMDSLAVDKIGIRRDKFADTYAQKWLLEYRTATEITFIGKDKRTMKVKVNFQHYNSTQVIHDSSLIDDAKKVGIKRIEFHDWGNFAREYLAHDIK
jgi:hypothetical protein